ncbi:MAG: HDIG domain-containing protein [Eubacterium sp.]|nr:HDIG domain-containing protein [Eubacterium sp.]
MIGGYNPSYIEYYGFAVIGIICFLLVLYIFIFEQQRHDLYDIVYRSYKSFFLMSLLCALIMACSIVFPMYTEPVMICCIICGIIFEPYTGMVFGLCFGIIYAINTGIEINGIMFICLSVMAGAMISSSIKVNTYKKLYWAYVVIMAYYVSVGALLYFLENNEINYMFITYSVSSALLQCVILFAFITVYNKYILEAERFRIGIILDKNYDLQNIMRDFDKDYYNHSLYVAKVCKLMAEEIGADVDVATCTGLYYHIGDMNDSEGSYKSAVKIALEYKFPASVIHNLYEIGAKYRFPSNGESLIAYITDNVFGELDEKRANNIPIGDYEIYIHQYTNQISRSGVMDKSGISMNQFLKIREILVRVSKEYDSNF